jgi:hypothetical protein
MQELWHLLSMDQSQPGRFSVQRHSHGNVLGQFPPHNGDHEMERRCGEIADGWRDATQS